MRTSGSRRRARRTAAWTGWTALVTALLLLASPASAATWTVVASPNPDQSSSVLFGAEALSSSNAWAVGFADRTTAPFRRPLIERWNGARWSITPGPVPPGGGELRDVDGTSGSNLWSVGFANSSDGFDTLTQRFNGSSWRTVPSPNRSTLDVLLGVKTLSGNEAWAVGSNNLPGSFEAFETMIQRWDGRSWRIVPSPNSHRLANHLLAIDGTSSRDLWAVGYSQQGEDGVAQPLILHYDGQSWSTVATPAFRELRLDGVVALAPNDAWAVGWGFSLEAFAVVPFALHWDGSAWRNVPVPNPSPDGGRLHAVTALSPTRVYAVGHRFGSGANPTLAMRWDGQRWSTETTPSPSSSSLLFGAAATGPATVWAVGARGTWGSTRTLILRTSNG